MARADLLLNLVKAGARGDRAQFQKTVEAMAADERAKKHEALADRLLGLLQTSGNGGSGSNGVSGPLPPLSVRPILKSLVAEAIPSRRIENLILPVVAEQAIRELVE